MDDLQKLLSEISYPSSKVKTKTLQDILKYSQKSESNETWSQIVQKVWEHLIKMFDNFDDQLLCGTCFFTTLPLIHDQEILVKLNEVLVIICNEIKLKTHENVNETSKLTQAVSLMYGMLQSSFMDSHKLSFKNSLENAIKNSTMLNSLRLVLERSFDLLLILAYEYSPYTFIAFKTLSLFKKIYDANLLESCVNTDQVHRLLKVVSHNWENPITGVRDLNKIIFRNVSSILSKHESSWLPNLHKCFTKFNWNKAKYLMLAELIEIIDQIEANPFYDPLHWSEGLTLSLNDPGLVSCGADMYYAILKGIHSKNDWIKLFLPTVINVLKGSSTKAIQNFRNYWLLNTLKKFPSLMGNILEELEKQEHVEHKLFSVLSLLKQGNKLELLTKYYKESDSFQTYEQNILDGLDHADEKIRILSFNIICSFNGKTIRSQLKYQLVLNYLQNNVNSSCTVLRIDMLSSYKDFLIDLHLTFLKQNIENTDNTNILEFCVKFQQFINMSLDLNGNYQRKITTLKLCDIFWSILNEVPKNSKKQVRKYKTSLKVLLSEDSLWILSKKSFVIKLLGFLKDPADDVRESTIDLLSSYYGEDLKRNRLCEQVISDAKRYISSKHFYQIYCGLSLFKLSTKLLINGTFSYWEYKTVEELFECIYSQLIEEFEMKRNVVKTIESGKQLHSFIAILHTILEVCNEQNYCLHLDINKTYILLNVLEGVTDQFSHDKAASSSSDFSEMNEMVDDIIAQSGNTYLEDDETKISGMQQLVLNCLWLNMKSSCELASLILHHYKESQHVDFLEKCLQIITKVLETSRHKGAIEAAGACLGKSIRYLTSLSKDCASSELPQTLLKTKLEDLYCKMESTTRRGAGMSIMVHRIVSSDASRNKPLFHFFMKSILERCCDSKNLTPVSNEDDDLGNARDVPKAVYIHYLTRIVADSSLATHTMFYCAKLGEIAFTNLTSTHWQIRNAALQLYGALVPKLIGQKKSSGPNEETIATVSWDEFHSHSPELWDLMLLQIRASLSQDDKVIAHSQLVPILSCLASLAKRFYVNSYDNATEDIDLLKSFLLLLGSPIYTVRRLTAKAVINLFPCKTIFNELLKFNQGSENFLHGCLLLVSFIDADYYRGNSESSSLNSYYVYREKIKESFKHGKHCYITQTLYNEVFDNYCVSTLPNHTILKILCDNGNNTSNCEPGLHVWARREWKQLLSQTGTSIYLSSSFDFEEYLEILEKHLDENKTGQAEVLKQIAQELFNIDHHLKFGSFFIWKILYKIAERTAIAEQINVQGLYEYLLQHKVFRNVTLEPKAGLSKCDDSTYTRDTSLNNPYRLRCMLPLLAKFIEKTDERYQSYLSEIILSYSLPDVTNEEMRYTAATANNELARHLNKLPSKAKINAILAAVILLQDEDEYVRTSSIHFYSNATNNYNKVHPFICLNRILDVKFLQNVLYDVNILKFCNEFYKLVESFSNCNKDENNPFSNDVKNIYMETEYVKYLIQKINTV